MARQNYQISSTAIVRLERDDDSGDVFVTFKDGRGYVISGMAQIEVERWANADSVGGYFNAFVRGRY